MASSNSMWHVYIVRCSDDSLYTGVTTDPDARVCKHNAGLGAKYTRNRTPVELVYLETAEDRSAAQRREYQLKKLDARKKHQLIAETGLNKSC